MKHLFSFLFFALLAQTAFSQHVAWAKQWGEYGYGPAVDAQGNIYVCGSFSGTVDFDPGPALLNLSSQGGTDISISKFSPWGELIWAKSFGGPGNDNAQKIGLSSAGDLYVIGGFRETADFDPGPGNMSLTAGFLYDTYLAKYDTDGNAVWAYQWGVSPERVNFTVDRSGNILLAGRFHGTRDFDPGSGTFTLTAVNPSGSDAFVCKLNGDGEFAWAFQIPRLYFYPKLNMDTDFQGNLYISGTFDTTVDFNPGPGTDILTTPYEIEDIFIAKYAPDAAFTWVKRLNTSAAIDLIPELVADSAGNTYYGGGFIGSIDVDPGPGTHYFSQWGNFTDAYLLKLDTDGNYVWAESYGSNTNAEAIQALALGADGTLYSSGFFTGTINFAPGPGHAMTTGTGKATFLSAFNPSGSFLWSTYLENIANSKLTADAGNNVYLTGNFTDSADFNPEATSLPMYVTPGQTDAYLVKVSACVPDFTVQNVSTCNSYTWPLNGGTYSSQGVYYQTVPGSGGCDSTVILDLVRPVIHNTIMESNGVLMANLIQNIDSYQWFNCNLHAPVNGATGPVWIPSAAGSYALIVQQDGCTDTSDCLLLPLGITENKETGFRFFPNPATDQITLSGFLPETGVLNIKIVDLNGRTAMTISPKPVSDGYFQFTLPTETLAAGSYTLILSSGTSVHRKILIKQ